MSLRIAWDIESGSRSEVTLPSTVTGCTTQDHSVLVIVRGGHLFIWESLSRLVEIDTTPLPEQALQPAHRFEDAGQHGPPLFFHPTDRTTFFVSFICRQLKPPVWLLSVHEFKLCNRDYHLSRSFSYDIKPHLLPGCELPDINALYVDDIRKVDTRGAFELLRIKLEIDGELYRVQCITFNALTTSFSVEVYEIPSRWLKITPRWVGLPDQSCLWEGQLLLPGRPHSGLFPTLVVLDQYKDLPSLIRATVHPADLDANTHIGGSLGETVGEEGSPGMARREIFRQRGIKANPTAPDYHSLSGLWYVLSLHANACTYTGGHMPSCHSSHLESPAAADTPTHYPLNHADSARPVGRFPGQCTITNTYADDDFLVVVTNGDTYTVFSVENPWDTREMAEVLQPES